MSFLCEWEKKGKYAQVEIFINLSSSVVVVAAFFIIFVF